MRAFMLVKTVERHLARRLEKKCSGSRTNAGVSKMKSLHSNARNFRSDLSRSQRRCAHRAAVQPMSGQLAGWACLIFAEPSVKATNVDRYPIRHIADWRDPAFKSQVRKLPFS